MKHLEDRGGNTMKNLRSIKSLTMLVVLVLAAVMFSAQPVQASGVCPAPGTLWAGALNMLHDFIMFTIPMARDAAQGNAGMFLAVGYTACQ
jgi:hypothetical protein